jgi:hypothetical protein
MMTHPVATAGLAETGSASTRHDQNGHYATMPEPCGSDGSVMLGGYGYR